MTRRVALVGLLVLGTAFGIQAGRADDNGKVAKLPADWFWGEPAQRKQQNKLVGQKPPVLDLSEWMNGEVKPEDMKGKVVLLDFWATWCGPCLAAVPHNNELAKKYADQGLVVIGVCGSPNGQEEMAATAKAKGIQYPIARDAAQKSAPAWKVMWWPTYAIIDRNGVVRAVGLKTDKVEDAVKKILAEQPAQKA